MPKVVAHRGLNDPKLYAVVGSKRTPAPAPRGVVDIRTIREENRQTELETKAVIDRMEAVFKQLEKRVVRFSQEEARLKRRKQLAQERLDRLQEETLKRMGKAGVKTAPGWHITFAEKLCPVSVIIDNESLLPKAYLRTIPASTAPDKAAIKAALERNQDVKGAHLAQNVKLTRT